MKICIVSDSHDRSHPLAAAISAAKLEGAEAVIHCGDLIGANTLRAAIPIGLPIHAVHGNNLGDPMALHAMMKKSGGLFTYHGPDAILELSGKRIFATHYPHYGRAIACTGDYDLVCCGHSHHAEIIEQLNIAGGRTWLVNPGSVAGIDTPGMKPQMTWVLGDLDRMFFEIRMLPISRPCPAS